MNDVAVAPEVTHTRLKNGMEVVVIPDHRAPVATHMVWYRNGAGDDPPGKSGIAHFLEHLMFKGTPANPAGAFSKAVIDLGGNENAFTGPDYTAYYQSIAREHLPTMMAFEADRMMNLALTDDVVIPERDVVLEERRMRVDNEPRAQLGEALHAALFTHHPYGTPIIGWEHEIAGLNREDALDYYRQFYTPANAILVVAGDVRADEVVAMAETAYGAISVRNAAPVRVRPQEPPPRASRLVRLADSRVEQPMLQRLYLAPNWSAGARGEPEALEVAAQLLGADITGFLYRKLVVERAVAVAASAWYQGDALDTTSFGVYAVPRPEVTLPALEQAMDEVLAEFLAADAPAGELARTKTRLIAHAIYARDSQRSMAHIYGSTLSTGGVVADVEQWPARIDAVTAGQMREVCARVLVRHRSATGYLESTQKASA